MANRTFYLGLKSGQSAAVKAYKYTSAYASFSDLTALLSGNDLSSTFQSVTMDEDHYVYFVISGAIISVWAPDRSNASTSGMKPSDVFEANGNYVYDVGYRGIHLDAGNPSGGGDTTTVSPAFTFTLVTDAANSETAKIYAQYSLHPTGSGTSTSTTEYSATAGSNTSVTLAATKTVSAETLYLNYFKIYNGNKDPGVYSYTYNGDQLAKHPTVTSGSMAATGTGTVDYTAPASNGVITLTFSSGSVKTTAAGSSEYNASEWSNYQPSAGNTNSSSGYRGIQLPTAGGGRRFVLSGTGYSAPTSGYTWTEDTTTIDLTGFSITDWRDVFNEIYDAINDTGEFTSVTKSGAGSISTDGTIVVTLASGVETGAASDYQTSTKPVLITASGATPFTGGNDRPSTADPVSAAITTAATSTYSWSLVGTTLEEEDEEMARTKFSARQLATGSAGGLNVTGSTGELTVDISKFDALSGGPATADLVAIYDVAISGTDARMRTVTVSELVGAGLSVHGSTGYVQINDGSSGLTSDSGFTYSGNSLSVEAMVSAGTIQGTSITATTAFVPDAQDGAALGTNSLQFSDLFLADGAVMSFGDHNEIKVTHVEDSGLTFLHDSTSDDKYFTMTLQTGDDDIAANDKLGVINFQAPAEEAGTDAILVAAGIEAVSEGDFSSSSNATKLSFKTASSAAAAETMSLSSGGNLTVSGTVTCATSLTIGSAAMSEADLEKLDGITNGTAAASKALVLDGSGNIASIGTVGCGAITSSGNLAVTGTITGDTSLTLDTTTITTAEIGVLDSVTAGAAAASKAVVLDGSKNIATIGTIGCGAITSTGTSVFANLDISGDIDVDGTTNLDAVDIDGAVDLDGTLTVGADTDGYDVKFFGNTTGEFMMWDESADELILGLTSKLSFHDGGGEENIVASSNGHLEINSGTTLDMTAPTVDINASTAVTIDTPGITVTDSTSSSATEGGYIRLASNDGQPLADDHRLGVIEFAAAEDTSSTMTVGARIEAIADATWSGTENGAALVMYTTDGNASQSEVLRLDSDKLATFAGGVTIGGDLTISGTTTTVNSTTIQLDDKNIDLAHSPSGSEGDDASVDGGGITLKSSDSDKTFQWANTGDNWTSSENMSLASTKVYKINNASVLSATTLGSSVVGSSLTSVGTIASGVWNGTAVASAYLDADTAHLSETQTFTGAKTFTAAATFGANDTGVDVKMFGDTSGAYLEWDQSADELELRGGAATPGKLLLSTAETTVVDGNKLGQIDFQAPLDSAGTDAILVAASIYAEADGAFSSSSNDTDLVFATGKSEAATEKMRLNSDGDLNTAGSITAVGSFIIGSASMSESDLEKLDGITNGAGAANKALVLDGNADIASGLRNVTISGTLSDGNYTFDDSGNVSGLGTVGCGAITSSGNLAVTGTITGDTSLTLDTTTITTAEIGVLDSVTPGTAAASKAVVLDASKNIATIGTIGCGAITSSGNLAVTGTITGDTSLTLDSTTITTAEIGVLDGVTPGTAAVSKAMVLDSNGDITGGRNLTISGTFSDGNYTFDDSGNVSGLGTVACGALTTTAGAALTAAAATIATDTILVQDGGDGSAAKTMTLAQLVTFIGTQETQEVFMASSAGNAAALTNSSKTATIAGAVSGAGSVMVFLNGQLLIEATESNSSDYDYTYTHSASAGAATVVLEEGVDSDDYLMIKYMKAN